MLHAIGFFHRLLPILVMAMGSGFVAAQAPTTPSVFDQEHIARVYMSARSRQQNGPAVIALGDKAVLNLPLGYSYLDSENANALMALMNNPPNPNTLGMVLATNDLQLDWFVLLSYIPSGWIDDRDGQAINAEDLLQRINEQTQRNDAQVPADLRFGAFTWLIPPTYDSKQHSLNWLLHTQIQGIDDPSAQGVNVNHLILGRRGFINATLASSLDNLSSAQANAQAIASRIVFNEGERYLDYRQGDARSPVTLLGLIASDRPVPMIEDTSVKTSPANQKGAASMALAQSATDSANDLPLEKDWRFLSLWIFAGLILAFILGEGWLTQKN